MFKVNNKDTSSGVFIVTFEHISHLVLLFLLLPLGWQLPVGLFHKVKADIADDIKMKNYVSFRESRQLQVHTVNETNN